LKRLLPFYTDVLGLKLEEVRCTKVDGVFCPSEPELVWLALPPGARLRLSQRGDASKCATSPLSLAGIRGTAGGASDEPTALRRGQHLAFRMRSIAQAEAVLERRGIAYETQVRFSLLASLLASLFTSLLTSLSLPGRSER